MLVLIKANAPLLFELARHFDAAATQGCEASFETRANELPHPAAPDAVLHADWIVARPDALALAVEVQTSADRLKRYTWLSYAAGVRRLFECSGWTLVVIPDPKLREWYQQMFEAEPRASPWFVEPRMLPPMTNTGDARRDPARATLTTLFHARSEHGAACARATLDALRQLDPVDLPQRRVYRELVLTTLTREQLEELPPELLEVDPHAPLGPMERTNAYFTQGREEGLETGRAEGLETGRAEGLETGREEGRCRELARVLIQVLASQNQSIDEDTRVTIEACRDLDELRTWLDAALEGRTRVESSP
ncbi:hypothetical protein PPSIR1_00887 [Plesiocystis pacifica SIR-1]|uniref:Flagellar assembly protein H n=1 Tax=Plesiocystis pacifica SIR-1 TaxID=391625 RepID=A6GCB1_9BACT|nr:hypothetical protein PPSIR1_00887 [Plesiocystis pacifica SIR-1]